MLEHPKALSIILINKNEKLKDSTMGNQQGILNLISRAWLAKVSQVNKLVSIFLFIL